MLIATFGPTTGWVGKTITYESGRFVLQDHGAISARDVMDYDAQGHLLWSDDDLKGLVEALADALGAPHPAAGSYASTAPSQSTGEVADETSTGTRPTVVESISVPPYGVTVEFGFSQSANFDFALTAAQKLPGYRQLGEGRKSLYRVTVQPDGVVDLLELVGYLKGLRSRTVYVDGAKTPWDSVFVFASCHERRQGSYKPEFYCFGYETEWQFNLWGCLQAQLPFTERADWFTWGRWADKKGTWEFDKARIRHELEKKLFRVRFCPALRPTVVESVLALLPSTVNPNKDKDWKFVEDWSAGGPGLTLRITEHGFVRDVVMKGVAPQGHGAAKEIIRRLGTQGVALPSPD